MRIEVVRENRKCPQQYADFLVRIGGLNPYGSPNFRFVWGDSATKTIYGQMYGGSKGQHIRLRYHGIPAWHFEEWKPADYFGDPESWYEKTYDYETGLHTMGDYPFRGDYICRVPLYTKRFEKGKLIIDEFPLTYELCELLVPAMWQARGMTAWERKIVIEAEREKERADADKQVMDAYLNAAPAFGGNDFSGSVNRERMLEKIRAHKFPISAEEIKAKLGAGHNQVRI